MKALKLKHVNWHMIADYGEWRNIPWEGMRLLMKYGDEMECMVSQN